jgi:lauroyl/myristoyl acyltransferase
MLPALRRLGPEGCDASLVAIGHTLARWPARSRRIDHRLRAARTALGAGWDLDAVRYELAGNLARFAARDCPLEGVDDSRMLARFDIAGIEHLDGVLADGRGAILLGGHFGAYLSAMHWLVRRRVPMRAMVQRPRHVSTELAEWFDRAGTLDDADCPGRHPQIGFFLRRSMPPGEGVLRVLRARSALVQGMAIFINGDVAWDAGCSRPGRLLGRRARYQSAWADLAVITRAPVLPIFCSHRPGGRFSMTIDPPWSLSPGSQQAAVDRYLDRLESAIVAEPAEAIAHLLWEPSGRAARLGRAPAPVPTSHPNHGRPRRIPSQQSPAPSR